MVDSITARCPGPVAAKHTQIISSPPPSLTYVCAEYTAVHHGRNISSLSSLSKEYFSRGHVVYSDALPCSFWREVWIFFSF